MASKDEPPDVSDPSFSYETDPHLFLFTSLTAGSSHIITATSRMETILKANRIPFFAIDIATDEKARRIWTRRSKGRTIPGLVKQGMVLGDLEQVEEWNEFGEIKEKLGVKKKKKKTDTGVAGVTKDVAKENAPPQELLTGNAPPAPDLPMDEAKDLPIRTKQPDTASAEPSTVRQESPKPGGQSSLAAEVAAAAKKRTKDKAAALKATVSVKQKETQEAGEDAGEIAGAPNKGAVERKSAAGPAEALTEKGESNAGGLGAVTDDSKQLTAVEPDAKEEKRQRGDGEDEPPVSAPPREAAAHSLDAAPATKSGEEAVTNKPKIEQKQDKQKPSTENVVTTATNSSKLQKRAPVEHASDAAPASESGEDAVTSFSNSTSKETTGAISLITDTGLKPTGKSVHGSLDAPPAAKSGESVVTTKADVRSEKSTATQGPAQEITQQDEAHDSAENTAKSSTQKRIESQQTSFEEPTHVEAVKGEGVIVTKEPKEEALDADKASESVED